MGGVTKDGTLNQDRFFREIYFPTMVFTRRLADADAVNVEILKAVYAERAKDEEGIQRSNVRSLGGWHSKNELHKNIEFKTLTDRILNSAANISQTLGYHNDFELGIDNMWAITNPPGSFNRAHIHPGSLWSGVYYVQAPENAGQIEFIEPRTEHLIKQAKFQPNKTRPKECWTKVRFQPEPGKMLFFPSWLYHSVEPNLSVEKGDRSDRVIVSYNLSQYKKEA